MAKKILKIRDVEERTGRKKSSIYVDIKAGTFPPPISLGAHSRGWIEAEIDEWIERRIMASRNQSGLGELMGKEVAE
jgi:prophage regulatory protein